MAMTLVPVGGSVGAGVDVAVGTNPVVVGVEVTKVTVVGVGVLVATKSVGVGVSVGVGLSVGVGVSVGVFVGVCVGVCVGVSVGVFVGVSVGVFVGVKLPVGVGVNVDVGVIGAQVSLSSPSGPVPHLLVAFTVHLYAVASFVLTGKVTLVTEESTVPSFITLPFSPSKILKLYESAPATGSQEHCPWSGKQAGVPSFIVTWALLN